MRRGHTAGALVVGAVLLAGCTTGEDATPPVTAGTTTAAAPAPCDDDERDGIDATVGGQLAAFAARDWTAARTYASRAFRSDVDADGLRAIILSGFPVLAGNVGHDLGTCAAAGTTAQVLVTVVDGAGRTSEVVYTLVREGAAWRVAGAVPHAGVPDQRPPAETA